MSPESEHASNSTRTLTIKTSKHTELKDVTSEIESVVRQSGCASGVCHLYVPHTTAGILINEGDDPAVARDIEATLERLIPNHGDYKHAEGNSGLAHKNRNRRLLRNSLD